MRHEDFTTLDLGDTLTRILQYGVKQTGATAVHWISAYGLNRVNESAGENWQFAFASADVVGQHMWSLPAGEPYALFDLWKQVVMLYPQPWPHKLPSHVVGSHFVHPVFFGDKFLGVLSFEKPRALDNPVRLMSELPDLEIGAKYLNFAYLHLGSRNESYLDELTGLYNQRYLPIVLDHEIGRAKRDGVPFTLLFLDIDYFKMVNDGRGHWVGSRLLVELGKVLRGQVRSCDYCFRYGGDEFIVLLGNASPEDSERVAERIRKAVETTTFSVEGHNLNLTVSIGLAAYPRHAQTAAGLIQIADQAMYYGKRKSRNIVFVAS